MFNYTNNLNLAKPVTGTPNEEWAPELVKNMTHIDNIITKVLVRRYDGSMLTKNGELLILRQSRT